MCTPIFCALQDVYDCASYGEIEDELGKVDQVEVGDRLRLVGGVRGVFGWVREVRYIHSQD